MEVVEVFCLFGASDVGKFTYLNSLLEDQSKPKDLVNIPIKWVFPYDFVDDSEEDILIMSFYVNRMLPETIGAIVMFDVSNRYSYYESITTIKQLIAMYPLLPIVWIGNKIDKERIVTRKEALVQKKRFERGRLIRYIDISCVNQVGIIDSLKALLDISCKICFIEIDMDLN